MRCPQIDEEAAETSTVGKLSAKSEDPWALELCLDELLRLSSFSIFDGEVG